MITSRDSYPWNLSMGRMDVSPAEMGCIQAKLRSQAHGLKCHCAGHLEVVHEGPCQDPKLKVFPIGDDAAHVWLLKCSKCSNLYTWMVEFTGKGRELKQADNQAGK